MEKNMEPTVYVAFGVLYRGLYRDNGKENGDD